MAFYSTQTQLLTIRLRNSLKIGKASLTLDMVLMQLRIFTGWKCLNKIFIKSTNTILFLEDHMKWESINSLISLHKNLLNIIWTLSKRIQTIKRLRLSQCKMDQLLIGLNMVQSVRLRIKEHAQQHMHFQQLELSKLCQWFSSKINNNIQFSKS